jgi:hypothetical protein
LVGALFAYGKKRGGTHGAEIRAKVIQWAVTIAIYGIAIEGIDNVAHAGGAIGGFLAAWLFNVHDVERKGRESDAARLVAVLVLLATLVAFGFAIHAGIEMQSAIASGRR